MKHNGKMNESIITQYNIENDDGKSQKQNKQTHTDK
jgi:hypothetical protein